MNSLTRKLELVTACQVGIEKLLASHNGQEMFGKKAEVQNITNGGFILRVPTPEGTQYFTIRVTANI